MVASDARGQAAQLAEHGLEAFKAGDAARSRELNMRSLELAREAGDPGAMVRALAGLMRLALRDHDFGELERLATECEQLADISGDASLVRMPLHMRAEMARMTGDLRTAGRLYDASIRLNRDLGNDAMVGVELANKSWVEIALGRLDEAESLIRSSLEATDDEDEYGVAFCLLGLARVELERGRQRGAAALGAAERFWSAQGSCGIQPTSRAMTRRSGSPRGGRRTCRHGTRGRASRSTGPSGRSRLDVVNDPDGASVEVSRHRPE